MHILVLVVKLDLALQWKDTCKELHSKHTERVNICIFHAIGNVQVRFIPTKCTGIHVSADKRSCPQGLYTKLVLS